MKSILYIGDFDLRNENVQAHLVKNMGLLFNSLGYTVIYIGINRKCNNFKEISKLSNLRMIEKNYYYELPYTLSIKGLLLYNEVKNNIIDIINENHKKFNVKYLITYQAPTFSCILSTITNICENKKIPYIVNSADITKFDSQPFFRRLIMKLNWKYLHYINFTKANGIIAVSRYIDNFYKRESRPSVIVPPLFNEKIKIGEKNKSEIVEFIYAGTPFINIGSKVDTNGMKDRLDKIVDLFIRLGQSKKFLFKIIGITYEEYITAVPRHKDFLIKKNNILFLGRKKHLETLNQVCNADFMINYRDRNEMTEAGLSTKVVESISLGTPVIMNNVGDTFVYLKKNINGFELTENINENVNLINNLINIDISERILMKQKCAKENPFKINNYMQKIKGFLQKIDYNYK